MVFREIGAHAFLNGLFFKGLVMLKLLKVFLKVCLKGLKVNLLGRVLKVPILYLYEDIKTVFVER